MQDERSGLLREEAQGLGVVRVHRDALLVRTLMLMALTALTVMTTAMMMMMMMARTLTRTVMAMMMAVQPRERAPQQCHQTVGGGRARQVQTLRLAAMLMQMMAHLHLRRGLAAGAEVGHASLPRQQLLQAAVAARLCCGTRCRRCEAAQQAQPRADALAWLLGRAAQPVTAVAAVLSATLPGRTAALAWSCLSRAQAALRLHRPRPR